MATWIAHLWIAENLLNKGYEFDPSSFAVGNIGPDSGVPNEDWSSFNPPKRITHWKEEGRGIDAEAFLDKYIRGYESAKENITDHSFRVGYYVHLLTDIEWSKFFGEKRKEKIYSEGFEKDEDFIWTVKKDWYGIDFLYLEKHPDCIFHKVFKNIEEVPDYLDYFPKGAFTKQVKYITQYYLGKNEETKENFIYLTEAEMDKFIEDTSKKIDEVLREVLL